MYATQINWNFNTNSTAYLVKSEDRRSLQKSQPKYNTVFFIVFFNNSGCVTAVNQISACTLSVKWRIKGSFTGRTGLYSGKA